VTGNLILLVSSSPCVCHLCLYFKLLLTRSPDFLQLRISMEPQCRNICYNPINDFIQCHSTSCDLTFQSHKNIQVQNTNESKYDASRQLTTSCHNLAWRINILRWCYFQDFLMIQTFTNSCPLLNAVNKAKLCHKITISYYNKNIFII
jgi:hypothetical protein